MHCMYIFKIIQKTMNLKNKVGSGQIMMGSHTLPPRYTRTLRRRCKITFRLLGIAAPTTHTPNTSQTAFAWVGILLRSAIKHPRGACLIAERPLTTQTQTMKDAILQWTCMSRHDTAMISLWCHHRDVSISLKPTQSDITENVHTH